MSQLRSGAVRGKPMEVTFRENKAYIQNLKKFLNTVSKKVYAEGVATVLHRVVTETVKDSGRAAANWNISFGGAPSSTVWDPKHYGDSFPGGSIGHRGDKGSAPIAEYKGFHYGYKPDGANVTLTPTGRISQAIKPGQGGAAPAAFLFNPIMNTSKEAFHYANNAFKTGLTEGGTMTVAITSELAGKIPSIIHETSRELRFPLTSKR